MLVEELRGSLVHRGSLVMNRRRVLMRPDMPALTLLVQALPISFAHNPSLSRETPDINLTATVTAGSRLTTGGTAAFSRELTPLSPAARWLIVKGWRGKTRTGLRSGTRTGG
jgi:hypothetical protein